VLARGRGAFAAASYDAIHAVALPDCASAQLNHRHRLLLLCGSQRAGSLNARLLEELAAHVPTGHAIDRFAPGEIRLPLYDADCEQDPAIRHHLAALHRRFAMADAFMLASPEYNGLMTPFLKNLIDWISRLPWLDPTAPNVFLDKPVLLCSATPGWSGGALGLVPLRSLLPMSARCPSARRSLCPMRVRPGTRAANSTRASLTWGGAPASRGSAPCAPTRGTRHERPAALAPSPLCRLGLQRRA
jgi:NAD(P)H-dependent FMN reductase